jgi:DNA-binding CsgD family transcriptional regulator
MSVPSKDRGLIGRQDDCAALRRFVDRAAESGGALLLQGEAGVGKTALMNEVAADGERAGTRVLRAVGAEFEVDLSFAALHQLLRPIVRYADQLGAAQRRALHVAFGLEDGPPADRLLLFNATLDLVVAAAGADPLLLIVDDLPWVDRASAVILGFVARRLNGTRVGFLGSARTGEDGFFERAGIPAHVVEPLNAAHAEALLQDRFPRLTPRVRARLIADAGGNPLALLELPAALGLPLQAAGHGLPTVLPLTRRLTAVFAARIAELPRATRELLLLAVLDGSGELRVLHSDKSDEDELSKLGPAERARLIKVDDVSHRLVFRHPLIRSAVVELSTSDERRRAHQILADRRIDEPEHHVWHLSEATLCPSKEIADLLRGVAETKFWRGDVAGGIANLLRAADLEPAGRGKSCLLAEAAYIGALVLGDLRDVPRLLERVRESDPTTGGTLPDALASAYYLLNTDGGIDTAHGLLVGAIENLDNPYDAHDLTLIEGLFNLLEVCFFGGHAELWEPFHAALERLDPNPPELLSVLHDTFGDPVRTALPILERLDLAISGLSSEAQPQHIIRVGMAAAYLDRLSQCRDPLLRLVNDGRDGGKVTSAIQALFLLAIESFFAGSWDDVLDLTSDGLEHCAANDYRLLSWPGVFLRALVAAARGDDPTAIALAAEMSGWAAPRRAGIVETYACHTRALLALGRGEFEEAYRQASSVSPPGVFASHAPHALWLTMDLVEACVRTNRLAEANAHVEAALMSRLEDLSPRLALTTRGAAALCAPDDRAQALFESALATPDANRWPFDHARIQLAYGVWLRRMKANCAARQHLAPAAETFERLGAQPWTARAQAELRAGGQPIEVEVSGVAALTPQQHEIALLAARGLTNKQIGQQMFLSHRTVATHLYQLFPKLGVTSRAALRDALSPT